jgi:UDP:flavonoid glycosyltransferase YjiC (YdhE family)
MTHFAFLYPAMPGHLNPMTTLGRSLQRRGHRVTFLQLLNVETKVLAEGLDFYPIGQSDFPLGTFNLIRTQLGELIGLKAVRHTIDTFKSLTDTICCSDPNALQSVGAEVLLVNQTLAAGATVAQFLDMPFVTVCNALTVIQEIGFSRFKQEMFRCMAVACDGRDAQLVISLGGGSSLEEVQDLPGSPLVVEYAPQLELLARARLTITHAGLNTVPQSLSNGMPMVAIPIANDQPAVAARLKWVGAGEIVSLARLSIARLRAVVERVLREDIYWSAATRLRESMRQSGEVMRAADIVEEAVKTKAPVLRAKSASRTS